MKTIMKIAGRLAVAIAALTLVFTTSSAQTRKEKQAKKQEEIKNLIESRVFKFEATYMTPLGGVGSRALTSDYDVRISPDSLTSYLPYYGRSYMAPSDLTKDELDFTSTKFEYQIVLSKKNGWEITIVPQDHRDLRKMFLEVTADGEAILRVTSNNRDPITFEGTIEPRKG